MANSLTFATRTLFDTALASGGSIATLMNSVTAANPSVAVVAYITETGESFSCGTNVMIDIKAVGPGDYIIYDSTNNKFFGLAQKWIDNNYPNRPTQQLMKVSVGVLPARFVVCGTCVKRVGNRIRIAGTPAQQPWTVADSSAVANYAWDVPALNKFSNTIKRNGSTSTTHGTSAICPSQRRQEAYFTANPNTTYLPCTRAEWNAAVIAAGYSPSATITVNNKTVNLADYDFSYDKFLKEEYAPRKRPTSGTWSDTDGRGNTRKIVQEFIANHGKTEASADYAAGYCYNYSVNAPGLGKGQWFFGTIMDMAEVDKIRHTLLTALSWTSGTLWSSTLHSDSQFRYAFYVYHNSYVLFNNKYNRTYVVPVSDLTLNS